MRSAQSAGLLTLLRADHHLGNEVDDGARRLLRVVLRKQVTYIVRGRASFPRHKAEDPAQVDIMLNNSAVICLKLTTSLLK